MKPTLGRLPQFLAYLGAFPPPDRVMEALVRGPLRHVGARFGMLFLLDDDVLVRVGSFGHTAEELQRYAAVPLATDIPIATAARERRLVVADTRHLPPESLGTPDEQHIRDVATRAEVAMVVCLPLMHAGTLVGALGIGADDSWHDDYPTPPILEAVGAALALWLTHPRAGIDEWHGPTQPGWSLAFTDRQRRMLTLIEAGLSNPAIAVTLHVSESSVKADLARAMRALRTSDRREAARRARALGLL